MESPLDLLLVAALSLLALGFTLWRFAFAKKRPACAPDGEARPQVLVGKSLARGLAKKSGR